MGNSIETFVIGGLTMQVSFLSDYEDFSLIPSFKYFYTNKNVASPDIKVRVGNYYRYKRRGKTERIKTSNGTALVQKNANSYRITFFNLYGVEICIIDCDKNFRDCRCELVCSREHRSFGLNTALLIIYVAASSFYNRMLIHSSTVRKDGKAYCFLGNSGEGKSTQSELWIKNIEGCSMLNDDMPILQSDGGKVKVWGSPWSGKTNYYINDSADMCAMVKMSHGKTNVIKRVFGIESYSDLLTSCSCLKTSKLSCSCIIDNIIKIVNHYPIYEMSCLPEASAARLCYETIEHDRKDRHVLK